VVTERSGEDDKTFTSDERLDSDVFDLLGFIAPAARHSTDELQMHQKIYQRHTLDCRQEDAAAS